MSVALMAGGKSQELKAWSSPAELAAFKPASSRERDPATGEVASWQGLLLSDVLEKAMASLSVDEKAQVDLLVLTGSSGAQAFVPRSVVTKFPVLLARKRGSQELPGFQVVIPWTSKPKVLAEEYLPLEDYFVPDLKRIELSSYRERFAGAFLKRQTDPSAIRGQKIVVQNCLGCHAGNAPHALTVAQLAQGTSRARALASEGSGHKRVPGVKAFGDRDRRAIMSFLDAYLAENPAKN